MKASWKTSLLGILASLALLILQAIAILDGDPETQPDVEIILAALGIGGAGVVARDNDVSSQDVGIRKDESGS